MKDTMHFMTLNEVLVRDEKKVANIQWRSERPLDSQIVVEVLVVLLAGVPVLLDATALTNTDASNQPIPVHRIFELAPLLMFVFTVCHFL